MSAHPRAVVKRRETITALPLYHSGQLQKKQATEKNFKTYFGELRGATLFLYKDDKEDTYTEKLDLQQLTSIETECPSPTSTIFNLSLNTDRVQLKMDNSVIGEEWRGFILTIIKKDIPKELKLLPGQVLKLQDVLNQERRRTGPLPKPPLPPRPSFLHSDGASSSTDPEFPECFYNVNRQEAIRMLQENPEYGGIIIRPSTVGNDYALTLRQITGSGASIKNIRVSSTDSGFVINLDKAATVPSLSAVLDYILEKTDFRLQPYVISQPYDTHLEILPDPKNINITSPLPKTVPKAQVAPMQRATTKEEAPPSPPGPENTYMNPDDVKPDTPTVRPASLGEELRLALKQQRDKINNSAAGAKGNLYERHISDTKPSSSSVLWASGKK